MNPPTASSTVPPVEVEDGDVIVLDARPGARERWRARRDRPRPPRPTWPSRTWALMIGLAFLVPMLTPLVLMANGVRPEQVDNRELAELPSATDVLALDKGALDEVQAWFRDNLPGLDVAIRANAQFQVNIVGDSPNPQVVDGLDDWLFLQEAIEQPCFGEQDVAAVRQTFRDLQAAAREGGRQLVLLVVPAKEAVHLDKLRPEDRTATCARANAEALAQGLTDQNTLVPLDLLDRRAAEGLPAYLPLDTHWTDEASHEVARVLVEHLGLDTEGVDPVAASTRDVPQDLRFLQGLPGRRADSCWRMPREGVVVAGYVDECRWTLNEPIVSTATTDGPALLPPTVFVMDSFGQRMLEVLPSWFQRLSAIYKPDLQPFDLAAEIGPSRIVVLEAVQRRLPSLLGRPELVAELREALATPASP